VECQTCLRLRVGYILGMKYRAFWEYYCAPV
jgi:hypothetical protein